MCVAPSGDRTHYTVEITCVTNFPNFALQYASIDRHEKTEIERYAKRVVDREGMYVGLSLRMLVLCSVIR